MQEIKKGTWLEDTNGILEVDEVFNGIIYAYPVGFDDHNNYFVDYSNLNKLYMSEARKKNIVNC